MITAIHSLQLIDLPGLMSALNNDPDLAKLNSSLLGEILQALYAVSGCDYTSFFFQIGKSTFLKYFYQYASFITGGEHSTTGTLVDISLENYSYNRCFLSFMWLAGIIYYKKQSTGSDTQSPATHYLKFNKESLTEYQQHSLG